jgi:hypothetical protein
MYQNNPGQYGFTQLKGATENELDGEPNFLQLSQIMWICIIIFTLLHVHKA